MGMGVLAKVGKKVAEMGFNAGGGAINWFPGHMAAATRAIRDRLKLADLVIEVRDARVLSPTLSQAFRRTPFIVTIPLITPFFYIDSIDVRQSGPARCALEQEARHCVEQERLG